MDSNLNKAHKTSPNVQPSGFPTGGRGGASVASGPDQRVLQLHARLCELVEDASTRAEMLGVPVPVDAAWNNGKMLPVLRAREKTLEQLVTNLERKAAAQSGA